MGCTRASFFFGCFVRVAMDDDERLLLRVDGRADGRADGWMGLHFHTSLVPRLFSLWFKRNERTRGPAQRVHVCV